jgi:hypothetical protein
MKPATQTHHNTSTAAARRNPRSAPVDEYQQRQRSELRDKAFSRLTNMTAAIANNMTSATANIASVDGRNSPCNAYMNFSEMCIKATASQ